MIRYVRLPVFIRSASLSLTHNIFTVDVEDWYHVCGTEAGGGVPPSESWRVRRNVENILALLKQYGHKATFFMLGSVAESDPELAPMIAAAGHEIASHGFSHIRVTELQPEQFREELQLTGLILEGQTGQRPVGYRAPQWSLSKRTAWAHTILREEGYRYDSSLNPLLFVGDPSSSRTPWPLEGDGEVLWEIPPLVTPSLVGNLPTGGGWGFRFFPVRMIKRSIDGLNRCGQPAVLYLHPRELDPDGPRINMPYLKSFVSYGSRSDSTARLSDLFSCYRFTSIKEFLDKWQPAY